MTDVEIRNGEPVIKIPDEKRSADDKPHELDLIEIGDTGSFRRTITDADVKHFAAATGDTNPYHFDDEYAAQGRFGERIAHGMLVTGLISTVLGTVLPGAGTIYLNQSLEFKNPVYLGDTITAVAEVLDIEEDKPIVTLRTDCKNQDGQKVVEGEAEVLVDYVFLEEEGKSED
ncbi:MAG: MaoC family dehydratase [Candidatus Thermoplasmatota archaeon]